MARTFEQISSSYPSDVQALARSARRLLLEVLSGATETVDPSVAVVSFGYGGGYKGMVCTLILSKSGVKLGLVGGARLRIPKAFSKAQGKNISTLRCEQQTIWRGRV